MEPDREYLSLAELAGDTFLCHLVTGEIVRLEHQGEWSLGVCDGLTYVQDLADSQTDSLWASDLLDMCVYRDGEGAFFIGRGVLLDNTNLTSFWPLGDFKAEWAPKVVCWSHGPLASKMEYEVAVLAGHAQGMRVMWRLQALRELCHLSADKAGSPTKWIHKNLARWRKHLDAVGLPTVLSSTPYSRSDSQGEALPGLHLNFQSVCTPARGVR